MNESVLKLYHHLPPLLRHAAAGAWGWRLRRWRYGPETVRLVSEALRRDRLGPEDVRAWQQCRLAAILERAATRVPYYREYWERRQRTGSGQPWLRLEDWPLLEKEELRRRPRDFVADGQDCRRMYREHTSGTTATPLTLYRSRRALRKRYAVHEARGRVWYGVSRRDRWALLAGQPVVPFACEQPPYWVWNAALKQLYVSAWHVSPRSAAAMVEALHRYGVRYVMGYPSALDALAHVMLRDRLAPSPLAVVVCEAEPLSEAQRGRIAAAFQAPVRESYGMVELVAGASECEAGSLHLWPECGWVEVLAEGRPAAPGEAGELVSTSLLDEDMPLVRYRTGDRVAMAPPGRRCRCGRSLPVIERIEGREDDLLLTPDGRRIGRMDPVFKSGLPIREAQLVQERIDFIRLLVLPAEAYGPHVGDALARAVRDRLGAVQVAVETVQELPRGPNGKFRAVISHVSSHGEHGAEVAPPPRASDAP